MASLDELMRMAREALRRQQYEAVQREVWRIRMPPNTPGDVMDRLNSISFERGPDGVWRMPK